MAENKVDILFDLKIQENRVKRELSKLNEIVKTADRRTRKYKEAVKGVVNAEMQLANIRKKRIIINKQVETSEKKLTTAQVQAKNATGATTSSVLELGRVISDAPYGIRGMANNLTQLISQLAFATKASGGLGLALKGMWKAMMGPLGIVLALTSVIALIDELYGANKKAETSVSDLRGDLEDLVKTLDGLETSQDNVNKKIQQYIEFRELASKSDEELKNLTEEMSDLSEEIASKRKSNSEIEQRFLKKTNGLSIQKYKLMTKEQQAQFRRSKGFKRLSLEVNRYNKISKEIEVLEQKRIDTYNESVGVLSKYNDEKKKLTEAEKDSLKGLKNTLKEQKERREVLSKTSEQYKKLTVAIKETELAIEKIEGKKGKKPKKTKLSVFETPEELELSVQNQQKAINKFNDQINQQLLKNKEQKELSEAKTEEEKKKIRERYEKLRLDAQIDYERTNLELSKDTEIEKARIKTEEHKKDLDRLFEKYKTEINLNEKLSPSEKKQKIEKAEAQVKTSKGKADTEFKTTVTQITEAYAPLFTLFNNLAKLRRSALGIGEDGMTGEEKIADVLGKIKQGMAVVSDFMNAETERQLTIERNKTNVLNSELNQRLLNEKLSAEERKNIQLKIAQNDEALRKKQNKIKKKQFDTQKAFNISSATIDTYLAASKAFAKGGGFPTGLLPMSLTIAKGLLNVAAIARQKFQPAAPSTPTRVSASGGSSATTQSRQPVFNIVGQNDSNQLAEVIQGQFNKPVKAYVVSKEVTTQQQLDLNIQSSASI